MVFLLTRLARLEFLISRRPELLNSVMLRQNPHNVAEWHKRVKLFEGNPTRQILTYTEVLSSGVMFVDVD
jgi:pre-mRNA-splicing factor SYF1